MTGDLLMLEICERYGWDFYTSEFDDVSSDVEWEAPIAVPPPENVFAGEDAQGIVGTWREAGCDPSAEANWAGVGGSPPREEG